MKMYKKYETFLKELLFIEEAKILSGVDLVNLKRILKPESNFMKDLDELKKMLA